MSQLHPIFAECAASYNSLYAIADPYRIGDYVYATDGRIVARCPFDGQELPPLPEKARKAPADTLNWQRKTYREEPLPIGDLPEPLHDVACTHCKGSGVDDTCDECDGTGEVTCEYDEEHDCPECDGKGKYSGVDAECEWCDSTGKQPVLRNVIFDDVCVREDLVRIIAKWGGQLYQAATGASDKALYWHLPGTDVEGLVMPVTYGTDPMLINGEEVPHIDRRTKAEASQ